MFTAFASNIFIADIFAIYFTFPRIILTISMLQRCSLIARNRLFLAPTSGELQSLQFGCTSIKKYYFLHGANCQLCIMLWYIIIIISTFNLNSIRCHAACVLAQVIFIIVRWFRWKFATFSLFPVLCVYCTILKCFLCFYVLCLLNKNIYVFHV